MLAHYLRRLRYYHMYPQKYLAEQIGISQAAYSTMERGITKIAEGSLMRIESVYGVDPLDLLHKPEAELIRKIRVSPLHMIKTDNHPTG
ncbi:MAG: helix-turn-helix transcriptional regulator [Saprospirales bacterium]|nr:helix-turn-helix transcriptional regulator [Saprospirales bacterium]MBK8922502.1 helix-turn-helix transcriptional regulator [Saprospirales bacterium]